jgi:hypothetical protein
MKTKVFIIFLGKLNTTFKIKLKIFLTNFFNVLLIAKFLHKTKMFLFSFHLPNTIITQNYR